MKKLFCIPVATLVAAFLVGCPPKPVMVKEEAKVPTPVAEPQAKPETTPEVKAEARLEQKPEPVKTEIPPEKVAKLKEELRRFEDIRFDFDKYDIKEEYRETLNSLADWLLKNKGVPILLEGHADDRGNHEYNMALSDRRASVVKDYLVDLGVSQARISTISYGEEKPVCTEWTEDCWSKNRRVHFVIEE